MARRRRDEGTPQVPVDPSSVHMDLRVSGPADKVQKQVRTGEADAPQKESGNGADEKAKFLEGLRNPKYIVRVKRLTPRELEGRKINVEVFTSELPLALQDIMEEVQRSNGGGKFRAGIVDPESNSTIGAYVFELPGDPIVAEKEMSPEEKMMFMRDDEKNVTELTEEGIDRRARMTAKMIEAESLEQQLRELREKASSGGKRAASQDDQKVGELERRLMEVKHEAEIERIQREHREKLDEVNEKLDEILSGKQDLEPREDKTLTILLEQMREDRKSADSRFEKIMEQMQNDKLTAMLSEIREIKNRPSAEGGGMTEAMKTFTMMAKMLGVELPGQADDDDDPDKPWYERLADKYLPKILDMFDEREKGGQKVSKEDLIREIEIAAKKAEDEAVARAKARVGQVAHPALPAPAPVATVPVPTSAAPPMPALPAQAAPFTSTSTTVVHNPALTQPTSAVPEAATAAIEAAAGRKIPSLEEEVTFRVAGVLAILEREIELRPRHYVWNYEGAWETLPESVLEKLCTAADPSGILTALGETPGVNAAGVEALKSKVLANPKILAWLERGLVELKRWWAKSKEDPDFDPADEEEELEEGQE